MSDIVFRTNKSGAWCVYINGWRISDHPTLEAARTAVRMSS